MNLQQKTLNRYRQIFPNESLRETSARTGIQVTRIYRLFQGKQMKVKELETFETIITNRLKESPLQMKLNDLLETASYTLTAAEMEKIIDWIERKSVARSYARFYVGHKNENLQSA